MDGQKKSWLIGVVIHNRAIFIRIIVCDLLASVRYILYNRSMKSRGVKGSSTMIKIKNISGKVIYSSKTARTVRAALTEALAHKVDIRHANLRGANLSGVDLKGANLVGVDFTRTDLSFTNLRGANFYGAELYGADLYGAHICGAKLRSANLSGVKNWPQNRV